MSDGSKNLDAALGEERAILAAAADAADQRTWRVATEIYGTLNAGALIAAVDTVLKLHVRQDKPVRSWNPCGQHAATALTGWRHIVEMEGCPVCCYDEQWVCLHCQCPHDEWPCPTVQAITGALLGEDGS